MIKGTRGEMAELKGGGAKVSINDATPLDIVQIPLGTPVRVITEVEYQELTKGQATPEHIMKKISVYGQIAALVASTEMELHGAKNGIADLLHTDTGDLPE